MMAVAAVAVEASLLQDYRAFIKSLPLPVTRREAIDTYLVP